MLLECQLNIWSHNQLYLALKTAITLNNKVAMFSWSYYDVNESISFFQCGTQNSFFSNSYRLLVLSYFAQFRKPFTTTLILQGGAVPSPGSLF